MCIKNNNAFALSLIIDTSTPSKNVDIVLALILITAVLLEAIIMYAVP